MQGFFLTQIPYTCLEDAQMNETNLAVPQEKCEQLECLGTVLKESN